MNKTFIFIGVVTGVTLTLEIYEKANMNTEGDGKEFNAEIIATRIFQCTQYSILIFYTWSLFLFFLRKKRERMQFKNQITAIIKERSSTQVNEKTPGRGFSKTTKLAIFWGFGVLLINTVNLVSYEIIQIIIIAQYL